MHWYNQDINQDLNLDLNLSLNLNLDTNLNLSLNINLNLNLDSNVNHPNHLHLTCKLELIQETLIQEPTIGHWGELN